MFMCWVKRESFEELESRRGDSTQGSRGPGSVGRTGTGRNLLLEASTRVWDGVLESDTHRDTGGLVDKCLTHGRHTDRQ